MQSTWERRVRQLASPQRGTGAPLRSARGAHSAQLAAKVVKRGRSQPRRENDAQPPCLPSTAGCVRWVMAMDARTCTAYQQPCFSHELVYAKSSTSRWIASRSRKLSGGSGAEGCCASAPSGCGCVPRRQSVQSVLPGALATDLEQPSCWHRLPPPCAQQWGVPPVAAALGQPKCWHRLPPPCALQCPVSPIADLMQSAVWHRLPPPCALQCPVSPIADLMQSAVWQRLPPPCATQCPVSP
jgi:hypothetical protein